MRAYFLLIICQCVLFVNCAPQNNTGNISSQIDSSSGIKQFSEFLATSLNTTVLAYNITPLSTTVGHYGSTLYSVEVKEVAENEFDEFKIQKYIVKTTLPNPVGRNRLFHFKESRFYTEVITALKSFEESKNISDTDRLDVFLQNFGTRISLDPNAEMVDSDYVLLLENVKIQNYHNIDDCFDIEDTFVVLKKLAKMHATFIAMKHIQPDLFNSKVGPYLMNSMYRDDADGFIDTILKEWHMVQNISTEMRTAVGNYLKIGAQYMLNKTFSQTDTPYTTLCHRDVKTANFMLKRGEVSNDETKVKIIDFQQMFYDSFVVDLIPFFYLSICQPNIDANFKEFVNYYHSEFLKTIKKYEYSSDDYTLEKIWFEVREKAKYQLFFLFKRFRGRILRKTKLDQDATLESIVESFKLLVDSFIKFELL